MQALKRVWSEELRGHLQHLALREADVVDAPPAAEEPGPSPAPVENVVRAAFPRREPSIADKSRGRPELSAALSAVEQAAEHIKAAEERAEQAQRQADEIVRRACTQLEAAEAEIVAAHDTLRTVEDRATVSAQRWADQVRAAEAQTEAARARCTDLETEIRGLAERLTASEMMLIGAKDHIIAAEARALEAREDMRCLAAHIREQFALPSR